MLDHINSFQEVLIFLNKNFKNIKIKYTSKFKEVDTTVKKKMKKSQSKNKVSFYAIFNNFLKLNL